MSGESKIDAAIAKVMQSVKRLGREDRNGQGGYNYASIDNFLEMTGKLCAQESLSVLMDEEQCEIVPDFIKRRDGRIPGLQMRFAITLRCEGEVAGPYRRSIIVPSDMGSQAFGAAQSYVLKQFLRATFQIPTGDKGEDIDAYDTGTIDAHRITPEQVKELEALAAEVGADVPKYLKYVNLQSLSDIYAKDFDAAKRTMEAKRKTEKPQASDVMEDEIPY